MLTVTHARSWQLSGVSALADDVRALAASVDAAWSTMIRTRDAVGEVWTDSVGDLAQSKMTEWLVHSSSYAVQLRSASGRIHALASAMVEAQHQLIETVQAAEAMGYVVYPTGVVAPLLGEGLRRHTRPDGSQYTVPSDYANDRQALDAYPQSTGRVTPAGAFEDKIVKTLLRLTSLDTRVAGELRLIADVSNDVAAHGASSIVDPPQVPRHMKSAQAAKWWHSLSNAEQAALLAYSLPALYGIKGLPAVVRDKANRWRLKVDLSIANGMLASEQAHNPSNGGDRLNYWRHRKAVCEHTQKVLDDWAERAPGSAAAKVAAGTPLLLIGFASGANRGTGETILSIGNPDTARNVSGFIEGVSSSPSNLPIKNAGAIIATEQHKYGHPGDSAMVIYSRDEPKDLIQGADQQYAEHNAPHYREAIASVYDSHRAVAGSDGHYTLFGHSYGTEEVTRVLVGDAGHHSAVARTDDVVMLSSPGVPADSPSDYAVPHGHVWAGTSHGDPIEYPADPMPGGVIWLLDQTIDPGSPMLTDPVHFSQYVPLDFGGHSSPFEKPGSLDSLARLAHGDYPP